MFELRCGEESRKQIQGGLIQSVNQPKCASVSYYLSSQNVIIVTFQVVRLDTIMRDYYFLCIQNQKFGKCSPSGGPLPGDGSLNGNFVEKLKKPRVNFPKMKSPTPFLEFL